MVAAAAGQNPRDRRGGTYHLIGCVELDDEGIMFGEAWNRVAAEGGLDELALH